MTGFKLRRTIFYYEKNVGNIDSLALVLYGYFKEGIIQQL